MGAAVLLLSLGMLSIAVLVIGCCCLVILVKTVGIRSGG